MCAMTRCQVAAPSEADECAPTSWVVLHDSLSTDQFFDSAYWSSHCDPGPDVDPVDYIIRVQMGETTDYFVPKGDRDLCTVLTATSPNEFTRGSVREKPPP